MKRKKREVELVYYDPNVLTEIMDKASHNCLSWEEVVENIELSDKELAVVMELSDHVDLTPTEAACLYLYYWQELPGEDIAVKLNLSGKMMVSRIIQSAKEKLGPALRDRVLLQNA